MSIRAKVILLVLPLIIAPLLLTGFTASLSARNGITAVATSLLRFKMDDLMNYANSQWTLLVDNNFVGKQEFVDAARSAIFSYARTLVRGESELIFALDADGKVVMSTAPLSLTPEETQAIGVLRKTAAGGWISLQAGGVARVAETASFAPFGWNLFVTEKREIFYKAPSQIYLQTAIILSASLVMAIVLLIFFSFYMTRPLRLVVSAMREIMSTNDLSRRVEILYRDETGELGHSFNLMAGELDKAYGQIKGYALEAAIAQHKEQKIRNIFQKFVPKEVIEEFFANPESMLVGQDRVLAILFSDIRSFTTISEGLLPNQVVESLNEYFGMMVEFIIRHRGIVDKYIGDAIMAFFGAPVHHDDDAFQSVMAGLEMLEGVQVFNAQQLARGRPPFQIGIGMVYGVVTLGNIGSEKKMDYTVIGDRVNVASRLEGLTKKYHEPFLVSESIARSRSVTGKIPCRHIDTVRVKGKMDELRIYAPHHELTAEETEAWKVHDEALKLYYDRDFPAARQGFQRVLELLPDDSCAGMFVDRCEKNLKSPPPEAWTGVEIITEK